MPKRPTTKLRGERDTLCCAQDFDLSGLVGQPIVVYAHIHRPYIRSVPSPQGRERVVVNTGSVGLSYDGDRRASYLLLEGPSPTIRRVEYDVEKELKALSSCGLPHADWIARSLDIGSPQMP
jgi:diadenosine tetraphosphatase ApaH/serine/threonine PP2A family protein phosphatase